MSVECKENMHGQNAHQHFNALNVLEFAKTYLEREKKIIKWAGNSSQM